MVDALKDTAPKTDRNLDLSIRLTRDVFHALHFDPVNDAFPPTRNKALLAAWNTAGREADGQKVFSHLVEDYLGWAGGTFTNGKAILRNLSTHGYRAPFEHDADIKIAIAGKIKERALWWNDYASRVFEKDGVKGLINDPSSVCLALGMGQWLDAGNIMLEPRFVGNSLIYQKRPELNLYKHFDIKHGDFALFPHIKHWSFYERSYSHLLNGKRMTTVSAYKSFREMLNLMEVNNIRYVVGESWIFDPALTDESSPVYNPRFGWVKIAANRTLEIGPAMEINPVLMKYALAISNKRMKAYNEGLYNPKVFVTVLTLEDLSNALSQIKTD